MSKRIMISSTARDLPEYREQVMDACMRLGMSFHPDMMEHLTAMNAGALEVSLKMVDQADLYIGIFAFRYGTIPEGQAISITEAEYNRAVELDIPRLIFLMKDDHPFPPSQVETGDGAKKLEKLKERLGNDRVAGFFGTPDDLRAQIIQALVPYRGDDSSKFHYVSDIPEPPETYIAHPYSLLQTGDLVGRQEQLNQLTDWVAKPGSEIFKSHILSVVAIGGMGKSALTWKWFNDIAPEEMKPLTGRMWWSFYESDAIFENFIIRSLAYISRRPIEEIRQISSPERESELISLLNKEPFLIALDGLERILIAYAGMDAARQKDSDIDEQKNRRKTIDPRAGRFLKKLSQVKSSRILISTRLFPAELETDGGDDLPSVSHIDLEGLTEDDALKLWREFGVSGSRDILGPIFDSIERHPLLIQALAGEVKRYKKAPGIFEKWRAANPHFDPASISRVQDAMGHVMEYALKDLGEKQRKVLNIVSAFRMPTGYGTLTAIVLAEGSACGTETELDSVLVELEDRGLIGWDKRANRYDLHPIVRNTVWSGLGDKTRKEVYVHLHSHFEALPKVSPNEVSSFEDMTSTVELYNTLVGLERYNEAGILFHYRLQPILLYRLGASRQRVELLEMLIPDGQDSLSKLKYKDTNAAMLSALAQGYQLRGEPGRAIPLYHRNNEIRAEMNIQHTLGVRLSNLAEALILIGNFRESEKFARQAYVVSQETKDLFDEAMSLSWLGVTSAARGRNYLAGQLLRRSLLIFNKQDHSQCKGVINLYLGQRAIWLGNLQNALLFAKQAWMFANVLKGERDLIGAIRLGGEVAVALKDFVKADEDLHHALARARNVSLIEEELPILVSLAELKRQQNVLHAAREFLNDVWEYAERGPYPLFHAEALNVLAQIERDEGNMDKAVEAAAGAYELAWCNGPPYAYHWELEKARKHLEELGAPLPEMPPFDESKFEPMPEVEIDPEDEFHVGESEEE